MAKEWFSEWFNSPYYHILYSNRNEKEAQKIIDNILTRLDLPQGAKVLDLACGKGRHSIYLNKKGYDVTGLDLSPENIHHASSFSNETLHFATWDMRNVYRKHYFQAVVNLFTSFGYFDKEEDNIRTLSAMKESITDEGCILIDFFNTNKIVHCLIQEETKQVQGIEFLIRRRFDNGYIVKDITFSDKGQSYHFQERVEAISRKDFVKYFNFVGLRVENTLGDYSLNDYNEASSDRMIFILKKNLTSIS